MCLITLILSFFDKNDFLQINVANTLSFLKTLEDNKEVDLNGSFGIQELGKRMRRPPNKMLDSSQIVKLAPKRTRTATLQENQLLQ